MSQRKIELRMRIIYLHQYFNTPEMEGGTRSYEMARRFVANGHEVHLITSDRTASHSKGWRRTSEAGINVHWLSVPYSNEMNNADRIQAFLKFVGYSWQKAMEVPGDIIFATSTPLTIALPGVWSAKKRGLPMVFEVRDLWPELPIAIGALKNPLAIFGAQKLERFAYKNSEHVIALSPGMREGVVASGYPAERVSVIPNSCDTDLFDVEDSLGLNWRKSCSWLGDRPLVVYTGTLGQINGVDYLVRVAEAVYAKDPEIRFLVVGSGKMKKIITDAASKAKVLDKNFFMLNGVTKEYMPSILSAATMASSLFVDLEPMWSNSANKFFDGLAAGKPIMINYGGWQAEILKDSKAGLVLPVNDIDTASDTLVRHLRDEAWLQNASVAARKLAREKFAREGLAQELEKCLINVHSEWASRSRFRKRF